MAKSKNRNRPIPPRPSGAMPNPFAAIPQMFAGYDPTARKEQRDVVSSKEAWSEYTLDDGTIVRTKGVLIDVKRAVDQFSPDGEPTYIISIAMVHNEIIPESLRRDAKKTKK